jgi:hypothetical protein
MAGTERRDVAERDDDWHRHEYVRLLHLNRERGLASGPVPTVAEIERRERGPVSEWVRPRRTADDVERHNWERARQDRKALLALATALALLAWALDHWSAGAMAGLDGEDVVPLRQ